MSRARSAPGTSLKPPADAAPRVGARPGGAGARLGEQGDGRGPSEHRRRPSRLWLRRRLRGVPAAAWLCAIVACMNAVCWSLITPPFEVPDEPEHVAYVKQIAETGHLPTHNGHFSYEEEIALHVLHLQEVAQQPQEQTISTPAQEEEVQRDLALGERYPEKGSEYAGVAASQPPLYYMLQSVPYILGESGTLLDRIELMRLLSALMAGLTGLFAFLFVREALPRVPWAWTVGGLGVALVPLFGFMSGAVNPDAMLYTVTAATFFALARTFRRGATRSRTIALGVLIAVGLMTKLNFAGIAPGVALGLIVLSVRAARTQGRAAYVSLAIALAIALSPVALYVAVHVASGAPTLGLISNTIAETHGSLLREIGYIWQLYLPRLPGMRNDFAGVFAPGQIWFKGYVGLYGWIDTPFPDWVYELALIPTGLIAILCVRGVAARIAVVRGCAVEARRVLRDGCRPDVPRRRRLLCRVSPHRRRIRAGSLPAADVAAARAGARAGGSWGG